MPFPDKIEIVAWKNMFCDRATYTLLMIFIFVNYRENPLKSFYHTAACLQLCPHLGNSRKGFFPNGKHFRCCAIGRHIHFSWFLYLSITGNTPWEVFTIGRRVNNSVPIWETVEKFFSLMGNILDVQVFHLANRNLTRKCVTSQIGNKRFPK